MNGKIIGISEDKIELEISNNDENLVNLHLVFESDYKIIGEVVSMLDGKTTVNLLGEIDEKCFTPGVVHKPDFNSNVRLIEETELEIMIGKKELEFGTNSNLGNMLYYNDYPVNISLNNFFSNHFSIFGNTGSGKSSSVSRILQNIFNLSKIPINSNIFIFDTYGEYKRALSSFKEPVVFKSYTTNIKDQEDEVIRIPIWLLGVDDIAILLNATEASQLSIIEKALKLVSIFAKKDDSIVKHKNDIIARALVDILSSGKSPSQIRDQVFAVLTTYNTKELNLETKVIQPGYTRTLRQCFNIDNNGKINEMQLVTEFIQNFISEGLELSLPDGSYRYEIDDLEDAFDFALISEGILKSDRVFDYTNILRVRLHSLVNSDYKKYFEYPQYITKEGYIKELITKGGKKAQIINFNINYVDDRFGKSFTKIFSKLLFDFATKIRPKGAFPFHIILEEAHRYVQNDNDINLLGYNIFDRITKEGRKYGVILGLISQRPSELSETAISQCSNFLIFRMMHPKDIKYIEEMVPNITKEIINKLRILSPGICIAFGAAFNIPVMVKLEIPNPLPESESSDIGKCWY